MRLPSYTTQDEKELIRNLASAIGGNEAVLMAEEYLNPGQVASQATLNTPVDTPLPSTPTQKFFPSSMPPPPYSSHAQLSTNTGTNRNSRYGSTPGVNEAFSTMGSRRYNSNFFSQSCDPLKMLEDDTVDCASYGGPYNYSNTTGRNPTRRGRPTWRCPWTRRTTWCRARSPPPPPRPPASTTTTRTPTWTSSASPASRGRGQRRGRPAVCSSTLLRTPTLHQRTTSRTTGGCRTSSRTRASSPWTTPSTSCRRPSSGGTGPGPGAATTTPSGSPWCPAPPPPSPPRPTPPSPAPTAATPPPPPAWRPRSRGRGRGPPSPPTRPPPSRG